MIPTFTLNSQVSRSSSLDWLLVILACVCHQCQTDLGGFYAYTTITIVNKIPYALFLYQTLYSACHIICTTNMLVFALNFEQLSQRCLWWHHDILPISVQLLQHLSTNYHFQAHGLALCSCRDSTDSRTHCMHMTNVHTIIHTNIHVQTCIGLAQAHPIKCQIYTNFNKLPCD